MRKLMMFLACAALVMLLGATVAQANLIHEGINDLKIGDVTYAEIKERVYDQEQSWGLIDPLPGDQSPYRNWYLYSYTVLNDMFENVDGGLWDWGYDDPNAIGITAVQITSPAGWVPINCPWVPGQQIGWMGGSIPKAQSLDTYWIVSPNGPYAMYDAYAHGTAAKIATGQVSGPSVPEPMSMTLLGLALVGGLAGLRKRRR